MTIIATPAAQPLWHITILGTSRCWYVRYSGDCSTPAGATLHCSIHNQNTTPHPIYTKNALQATNHTLTEARSKLCRSKKGNADVQVFMKLFYQLWQHFCGVLWVTSSTVTDVSSGLSKRFIPLGPAGEVRVALVSKLLRMGYQGPLAEPCLSFAVLAATGPEQALWHYITQFAAFAAPICKRPAAPRVCLQSRSLHTTPHCI